MNLLAGRPEYSTKRTPVWFHTGFIPVSYLATYLVVSQSSTGPKTSPIFWAVVWLQSAAGAAPRIWFKDERVFRLICAPGFIPGFIPPWNKMVSYVVSDLFCKVLKNGPATYHLKKLCLMDIIKHGNK